MKLKTSKNLHHFLEGLAIVNIILAFIQAGDIPSYVFILIAGLLFVASAYIDYNYWRCPNCTKHLGKKMTKKMKTCPHCGYPLDPNIEINAKKLKDYFYGHKDE